MLFLHLLLMLVVRAEKRIRQNIMEVLDAILQNNLRLQIKVIIHFFGCPTKKQKGRSGIFLFTLAYSRGLGPLR